MSEKSIVDLFAEMQKGLKVPKAEALKGLGGDDFKDDLDSEDEQEDSEGGNNKWGHAFQVSIIFRTTSPKGQRLEKALALFENYLKQCTATVRSVPSIPGWDITIEQGSVVTELDNDEEVANKMMGI